jgi:hypothetical protein
VIANPYRKFYPKINYITRRMKELQKGQDQQFEVQKDQFKGFFKRFNNLKEKLVFMDNNLFTKPRPFKKKK